jgi:hypothetical protein
MSSDAKTAGTCTQRNRKADQIRPGPMRLVFVSDMAECGTQAPAHSVRPDLRPVSRVAGGRVRDCADSRSRRHVFRGPCHRGGRAANRGRGDLVRPGKTRPDLFPDLTRLTGDRDTGDYAALGTGSWDAVVDPSGYVPRHVSQAMDALGERAGRYLFISSHAVYQLDGIRPGSTEDTPRRPAVRDTGHAGRARRDLRPGSPYHGRNRPGAVRYGAAVLPAAQDELAIAAAQPGACQSGRHARHSAGGHGGRCAGLGPPARRATADPWLYPRARASDPRATRQRRIGAGLVVRAGR